LNQPGTAQPGGEDRDESDVEVVIDPPLSDRDQLGAAVEGADGKVKARAPGDDAQDTSW
jgi:hypothetical protein